MSLINGWKHEVVRIFHSHIENWACDHKNTKTAYHLWCNAMYAKETSFVIDHFSEIIVALNNFVNDSLKKCNSVKSTSLGKLHQKTEFSKNRIAANLQGRNREVTLERAIVRAMQPLEHESWYNQFNVASGLAGSTSDKKTSVDLVRHDMKKDDYTFIELKDWKATDSPLRVLFEIILYGILFSHAKQFTQQQGLDNDMLKMNNILLAAMIPDSWIKEYGTASRFPISPDCVFKLAGKSLQYAQAKDSTLMQGIKLEQRIYCLRGITRAEFQTSINDHSRLREWINTALISNG